MKFLQIFRSHDITAKSVLPSTLKHIFYQLFPYVSIDHLSTALLSSESFMHDVFYS